jgi:hypothetical protein
MHGRFWADGKEWFLGYEAQRLGMGLRECYAERYADYTIIMVNAPRRTTRPLAFNLFRWLLRQTNTHEKPLIPAARI